MIGANITFVGKRLGIEEVIKAEKMYDLAAYNWQFAPETIDPEQEELLDQTVGWAADHLHKIYAKYQDQVDRARREIATRETNG